MKKGDLVKWTFSFGKINSDKLHVIEQKIGILLYAEESPIDSWIVLLEDGSLMHADITELEVLNECR